MTLTLTCAGRPATGFTWPAAGQIMTFTFTYAGRHDGWIYMARGLTDHDLELTCTGRPDG
jgi:hypothetical protein